MLRYTKLALLIFGAGLLLGLAAVVGPIRLVGPLASGLMAAGILGIPLGLVLDWRRAAKTLRQRPPRRRKRPTARPRRRPRKPTPGR
jgi:hypothetical protein